MVMAKGRGRKPILPSASESRRAIRRLDRQRDARVRGYDSGSTWSKYGASTNRDTGTHQTNYFEGTVGERDQRKKVHIAIDENHNVIYVREIDGTVLYDRANNVGSLPPDLDWSH
jgi:hypothetical protein